MTRIRPADDPVIGAVRGWLAAGYLPAGAPLVVACSGGADSLALAVATIRCAAGHPVSAAVVDHGLQPGSARVARTAADTLRGLGYARVDVRAVTVRGPGGPEAAARAARYAALSEVAGSVGPGAAVLLAHTADDQAETVLLGLARGSGPRSIAGMRPWRAPWGRPLLTVRRADTEAACAAAGLRPWRDPHNADPRYSRVRVRSEVLPLLGRVLGGGVVPALARTAELMADDLAALDDLAGRALAAAMVPGAGRSGSGTGAEYGDAPGAEAADDAAATANQTDPIGAPDALDCAALAGWPAAVRRRVLRAWVIQRVRVEGLTYRHLTRLDGLVTAGRTGSAVRLPGAIDVVRRRGKLVLVASIG